MAYDLPFKIVRTNAHDVVIGQTTNFLIARTAYEMAVKLFPKDCIELRQGARIIEKSK